MLSLTSALSLSAALLFAGCTNPAVPQSDGSDSNGSTTGTTNTGGNNNNNNGSTDTSTTTSSSGSSTSTVGSQGSTGGTAPASATGTPGSTDYVSDTAPSSAVGDIFPNSLSLDTGALPDDSNSKQDLNSQVSQNVYRRTLISTGAVLNAFHRYADRAVLVAKKIQAKITDPNQTNVTGSFLLNGVSVSYKADFSAFDIDGDGTPDGSGTAAVDPVAVRMWVDRGAGYQPFLCALITHRPANGNLGAGVIYAHPNAVFATAADTFYYSLNWDRTDSSHKWNVANLTGRVREFYTLTTGVYRVDQRLESDNTINKTVRANAQFTDTNVRVSHLDDSVIFRSGSGKARMTSASSDGAIDISITDACVDLTSFSEVKDGSCDAFDTQDAALLPDPSGTETTLPADFPATPTF